jgi:hypothetical protein
LSGGQASLRRDPVSTACLLIALCPRYPSRTPDNQYHLQALRHLGALAVEPRALQVSETELFVGELKRTAITSMQVVDVDTGLPIVGRLWIRIEKNPDCGDDVNMLTPCLLPELATVKSVHILLPNEILNTNESSVNNEYYPTSLHLQQSLSSSAAYSKRHSIIPLILYVKKKSVSYSYQIMTQEDRYDVLSCYRHLQQYHCDRIGYQLGLQSYEINHLEQLLQWIQILNISSQSLSF